MFNTKKQPHTLHHYGVVFCIKRVPVVQGAKFHMKLLLYLKLQEYFDYGNDRTHVIKVVVLVVKITIQLTYGIHDFKKKKQV
jgi:hypothetical protein